MQSKQNSQEKEFSYVGSPPSVSAQAELTKYTQLIEQAVHEPGPTVEEVCQSIELPKGAL